MRWYSGAVVRTFIDVESGADGHRVANGVGVQHGVPMKNGCLSSRLELVMGQAMIHLLTKISAGF